VTDCEVGMGEIKVARNPSTLTCLGLGSCVVLIIYDEGEKAGGIAHIMLPSSNQAQPETRNPNGKYADVLSNLGSRTIDVVTTELDKLGIPIVGEDVGGNKGRSLIFDLANGSVTIKTIFGDKKEL